MRKWQPTPVFLPRESHGHRSLVDYIPLHHKESDMTEATVNTKKVKNCLNEIITCTCTHRIGLLQTFSTQTIVILIVIVMLFNFLHFLDCHLKGFIISFKLLPKIKCLV